MMVLDTNHIEVIGTALRNYKIVTGPIINQEKSMDLQLDIDGISRHI